MTELTARELLIMLYDTALDAVDGQYLVNQWCRQNLVNQSGNTAFTHCIAIGKAAPAMLQAMLDRTPSPKQSLLICPAEKITRALSKNKTVTCLASSHPIPDETSLAAGRGLLDFLASLTENDTLIFLISGGSSSMVEVLKDTVTLEQLQQINRYLLSSGKDIHQVNAWRQQFSKIKGGGLLHWIKAKTVTQLLLSDVKDDKAEFIGSGLLVCSQMKPDNDDYLVSLIVEDMAEKENANSEQAEVETHIIGNIKMAMTAVHEAALTQGLQSFIHDDFLQGDAIEAADRLFDTLKDAEIGVHIWGGETTVQLPDKPGVGGRNLTLALAFARHLSETPGLHLLAAGTDGVDGNSNCAGAAVSMYTAAKAKTMGFDIQQELTKANAGIVLMATDDLVRGSHSRTNVMDIVIAYKSHA